MEKKNTSRRQFLYNSAKLGAFMPFVASPLLASGMQQLAQSKVSQKKSGPLNILILGGTSFLGPFQIAYALKQGHKVTIFTRGKSKPQIHNELFKDVEQLVGDREDNLEALKGRKWDAVIDNSGRKVKWTEDTAELLKENADIYLYVSSVSVYYPFTGNDFSEDRKLVLKMPADAEKGETRLYEYGTMKANSEIATREIFGKDRSIIVRPTFIVGPGDKIDRFNYWPIRAALGGEILVPGEANDKVQFIDVRDLAGWMIRLIENKNVGTYNGCGPAAPMTSAAFVHGVHAAFSSPASFTYVDDYDFLKEHGLKFMCPWVMADGKFEGMVYATNQRALETGITYTPLAQTAADIKKWWYTSEHVTAERREEVLRGEESNIVREKEILKLWRERLIFNNK